MDAPIDPMHKDDQESHHESDTESTVTMIDPKEQHIFDESRTKRHQEQGATSSIAQGMEAQLKWLIKEITDATDAMAEEMKKSMQ